MLEDRYGNALTTSSADARDAFVEAMDRLLAADIGMTEGFERAVAADPDFALAHLALARARQMVGEGGRAAAPLAEAHAAAERRPVSAREAGCLGVLSLVIGGKGAEAYPKLRAHLAEHPRDALVAQPAMGVFGLIGFSGQPGREAEQLAYSSWLAPHFGDDWWFLSQHAFAQLEAGQLGPAEVSIERSLAGNPRSGNGAHVRSHLYYENGESRAGLAYIADWRRDYAKGALLHCHVSWHQALWSLEQGDVEGMWRIHDVDIAPEAGVGPPINVITDSAALLFRAELAGVEVPLERWRAVSAYASKQFPNPGLGFVDIHAALAHAIAGEGEALDKVIRDAKGPTADLVREVAEGFGAMAKKDWAAAIAHLTIAMADHARLGGSRAQRDLLEFALAGALLRSGQDMEARRMLTTRRPRTTPSAAIQGLPAA